MAGLSSSLPGSSGQRLASGGVAATCWSVRVTEKQARNPLHASVIYCQVFMIDSVLEYVLNVKIGH